MNNDVLKQAIELAKQGLGRHKIIKALDISEGEARAAILLTKVQEYEEIEKIQLDIGLDIKAAFGDFDEGIDDSSKPIEIEGDRILVLSDIHFPRHDKKALVSALEWGYKYEPDCIYLNGDIIDAERISHFAKSIEAESLKKEINLCKEFLVKIRGLFPKAAIYYKEGNHEKRFTDYVMRNAEELFDLVGLSLSEQLGLEGLGVHHVPQNQIAKAGKLFIAHGHEYRSHFGGGIYHARQTRIKAGVNILIGHYHRTQTDIDPKLDDTMIGGWGTGCLCNLNPAWIGRSKWNHGFATVERSGENFQVDNRII
jgi:predicted phosphodiesterase